MFLRGSGSLNPKPLTLAEWVLRLDVPAGRKDGPSRLCRPSKRDKLSAQHFPGSV